MNSLWYDTAKMPEFRPLSGDVKTDVLIIGGGMAGILCAYMLHGEGVDCRLLEARTVCGGVTGCTTAKITSQHGFIYQKLLRRFGAWKAKLYLEANEAAIHKYREICRNIDCDFESKTSYIYSADPKKISNELKALEKIGYTAEYQKEIPIPVNCAGAVGFRNQAQFHPLKFAAGVCGELPIHEHSEVRELKGLTAVTDNGTVTAKKIIVATHFPFINKHGSYFLKLFQHRSYVIALDGAKDVGGMYLDESETGLSFRNYKNLLLVGGGGHRTGKPGGCYRQIETFAAEHYPDAQIRYRFATQDCMSLDGVPYIGRYSKGTDGLYAVTGFNKWGMTSSMVAAGLLCDLVTGRKNKYEELFSPSRSILRPQLAANSMEAAAGLLYPSLKRCPHTGCALKWNSVEHSWDCPCHGSRFTAEGKLIDNPATGNLREYDRKYKRG